MDQAAPLQQPEHRHLSHRTATPLALAPAIVSQRVV
jgi:hypothetical protein